MIEKLEHRFVETIPDKLEEGVLYVSLRFRVVMHSCCCGCESKVITPLSPARWKMTFDGKSITLYPSIGNWNSDCQSHYWITENEVIWDKDWSKEKIAWGKTEERKRRANHYKEINSNNEEAKSIEQGLTEKIKSWIYKLFG